MLVPVDYVSKVSRADATGVMRKFVCIVNRSPDSLLPVFVIVLLDSPGRIYEADSPDHAWMLVEGSTIKEGMGRTLFGFDDEGFRKKLEVMDKAFQVARQERVAQLERA
jgi:hypothetical protein